VKIACILPLLIVGGSALAGTETGTVQFGHGQYASNESSAGYTFFFLEGATKSDNPACSTAANGQRWVFDNDWPAARIQIATLIAAFTAGRRVTVIGSGNCSVWGDTETAVDIMLVD
jgi:hypothetical protein